MAGFAHRCADTKIHAFRHCWIRALGDVSPYLPEIQDNQIHEIPRNLHASSPIATKT